MNNRVAEIRKTVKLSQDEFGSKIGLTKSAISKIEKGENALTDKNIILICSEFNVNEEWLRTGEGDMFNEESALFELLGIYSYNLNEIDKRFISNYLKLSPKQRELFREFLIKLTE